MLIEKKIFYKEKFLLIFLLLVTPITGIFVIKNFLFSAKSCIMNDKEFLVQLKKGKKIKSIKKAENKEKKLEQKLAATIGYKNIFFRKEQIKKEVQPTMQSVVLQEDSVGFLFCGIVEINKKFKVAVKRQNSDRVSFIKEGDTIEGYRLDLCSANMISLSNGEEKIDLILGKVLLDEVKNN
jgi:hypothetical protein